MSKRKQAAQVFLEHGGKERLLYNRQSLVYPRIVSPNYEVGRLCIQWEHQPRKEVEKVLVQRKAFGEQVKLACRLELEPLY